METDFLVYPLFVRQMGASQFCEWRGLGATRKIGESALMLQALCACNISALNEKYT
jgi:hypothetical protein